MNVRPKGTVLGLLQGIYKIYIKMHSQMASSVQITGRQLVVFLTHNQENALAPAPPPRLRGRGRRMRSRLGKWI